MKTLWTFNIGTTRYLVQTTKNGEWISVNNMDTGQVWEIEGMYFNQYCNELSQVAKQFDQIQNLDKAGSFAEHMIEVEKYEDREIKFENSEQENLYNKLRLWRSEEARKQKLPAYIIFNNITFFQIAKHRPSSEMDLMKINGIGKVKLEKYGTDLIKIVTNPKKVPKQTGSEIPQDSTPKSDQITWEQRIEQVKNKFPNFSMPWTDEQNEKLKKLFKEGYNINQISATLQRTMGGIKARLEKLGFINEDKDK